MNPNHIGEIWVWLAFADKSEYTSVGVEQIAVGPIPTRVNEKDKKPGAHCATCVLGCKVWHGVYLVQQPERIIRGVHRTGILL